MTPELEQVTRSVQDITAGIQEIAQAPGAWVDVFNRALQAFTAQVQALFPRWATLPNRWHLKRARVELRRRGEPVTPLAVRQLAMLRRVGLA